MLVTNHKWLPKSPTKGCAFGNPGPGNKCNPKCLHNPSTK